MLSYRTKLVKEFRTVFLNEHINKRFCGAGCVSFIGLFDLPGSQNLTSRPNSLDQIAINFSNKRLHNFIQKKLFESHVVEYNSEGISRFVPQIPYFDNSECLRLLQNQPGGLLHIMDDQRTPKTDHTMVKAFGKRSGNHSSKVGSVDRSGAFQYLPSTTLSSQRFPWPKPRLTRP